MTTKKDEHNGSDDSVESVVLTENRDKPRILCQGVMGRGGITMGMGRRSFLKAAVATGIGMGGLSAFLESCSGGGSGGGGSVPAQPQNFMAYPYDQQVALSWSAVAGATSYEYRVDGGAWVNVGTNLNVTKTGLTNNQQYSFEVSALNSSGRSPVAGPLLSTPTVSTFSTYISVTGSPISTPGRLTFYEDYSELSSVGVHTFKAIRICGAAGAVGCTYTIFDSDGNSLTSGNLSWADGDMSVLSFTYNRSSKQNGIDRIHVDLSSPSGGVVLHHDDLTRAYGVIDDGTVPDDSISIFVDTAGSNGTGTSSSPYNNIYDAITEANANFTKRFILLKGTQVVDDTNIGGQYGGSSQAIHAPIGRTGESDRLTIMGWPGFTGTIEGSNNSIGIVATGTGEAYSQGHHSYRNLTFQNFSELENDAPAIHYHYTSGPAVTMEHLYVRNCDGAAGTNTGGLCYYAETGMCKIYACDIDHIGVAGDETNHNSAAIYSFLGNRISVQHCLFGTNMGKNIYQKRTGPGNVSVGVAFCHITSFVELGNSTQPHGGFSFHNNIVTNPKGKITHITDNNPPQDNNTVFWNYFYNNASDGDDGSVFSNNCFSDMVCYGNVFDQSFKAVVEYADSLGVDRFIDYNVLYNIPVTYPYRIDGVNYSSSTDMYTALGDGFGGNDVTGDPLPVDSANLDFTLSPTSSAKNLVFGVADAGCYPGADDFVGLP